MMTEYTPQFELFWKAYPSRGRGSNPKFPAFKAWKNAMKVAGPQTIIDSLAGYKEHQAEHIGTPLICQATTYLNQRRWEDYVTEPSEPPALAETPERQGLQELVGSTDYELWFKAPHCVLNGNQLVISTPFRRKWIEQQYGLKLAAAGYEIKERVS